MPTAPLDHSLVMPDLTRDPYPIYARLRAETPVVRAPAIGRTMLTKAEDTRFVKDHPELFSSNDPITPMTRAFQAHTLMRKDGEAHLRERNAMMPTFSPRNLKATWMVRYEQLAAQYLDQLPRGEVIDLFPTLAGPLAAHILAECLGLPDASPADMQRWSQTLIDAAGNFGERADLFKKSDRENAEMNAVFDARIPALMADPDQSALSVMINAEAPIEMSQIRANLKIAIGGGINEPRDALLTILYGVLTNPDQLNALKDSGDWGPAFEEGVRWVAPIQVSARRALQDTQIRGIDIAEGEVLMTVQASANWDEDLFEAPEKFDVFRKQAPHQSFGSGPHHCMGTHMARAMLGKILLPMLFDRFPNMRLAEAKDVVWSGFGFRGPLNLPVRLT